MIVLDYCIVTLSPKLGYLKLVKSISSTLTKTMLMMVLFGVGTVIT